MPETVVIVIVSYNAKNDLARCLEALTVAPPRRAHEIVVVDNASQDGGPAMVRARWPGVRVIERATNAGFAAANNEGIRATNQVMALDVESGAVRQLTDVKGDPAQLRSLDRQSLRRRGVLLVGQVVGHRGPNRDHIDAGVSQCVVEHTEDPGGPLVARRKQAMDGQIVGSIR